ncbi:MAG: PD-(D/E)XK nuclease family protein [Myxococcota bacterium]|nr:PD-(D/E)XK nuclease family protein [Myxococcota bacterium]
MSTVYSHSRLASFENCPRQFFYRYVEKVPVDTESIEAFLGKRVHEVLERLNRFVERGMVPSLGKVIERFRTLWTEQFQPERVRIVRGEVSQDSYRELGERCLTNHYRRNYPFDEGESLGIEQHVTFPLDADGRYRMRGIVDRIVRARDGAVEIHDYKTGRWVPTQSDLDQDRQLALYQIGVEQSYGATSVRLVWHYLQRDQVRISTRTAEQLVALREATMQLIDRIEAESDFDPRPSTLCSWCEFRDLCPAADAAPRARDLPPRNADLAAAPAAIPPEPAVVAQTTRKPVPHFPRSEPKASGEPQNFPRSEPKASGEITRPGQLRLL